MRFSSILVLVYGVMMTLWEVPTAAQVYERPQPIVLAPAAATCESPAQFVQAYASPQRSGDSQLSPSISESMSAVAAASELVPLPAGPVRRGYTTQVLKPVWEVSSPSPAISPTPYVLGQNPDAREMVPEGYIVGRGLIGQPKLYKPGQPMRNLLRYLSL